MVEPVLVDVSPILEVLGESVEFSGEFELESFSVGVEVFALRGPVRYDMAITNTGTAVLAMGRAKAPVVAMCSRCLCDFPAEIAADVEGFYVLPGREADVPEEQAVEYILQGGTIDLGPAIMAALVLEAPFAPLHDEECAGICPTCGADLNEGPCACMEEHHAGASPFRVLSRLLDKAEGKETRAAPGDE